MNNTDNLVYDCYYLINLFELHDKPLTYSMLCDLIFLFESYYICKYNVKKLYDFEYEAWHGGPVISQFTKIFPICEGNLKLTDNQKVELSYITSNGISNERKETMIEVYNTFGNFTPEEIKRFVTCKKSPWYTAFKYTEFSVVRKDKMKEWFKEYIEEK